MRSIFRYKFVKLSVLTILSCLLAVISFQSPFITPAQAQSWNLVWSDEFNGTSVNTANWTFETGGSGWGNNELEYYTNGANASVGGGVLTITARAGSGGFSCWYGTCQYTSTRMNTSGKKSWTYGKIETRAAMPVGQGMWPAFWMLGQNIGSVGWPASGEIDIMERVNNENLNHGTIHWDSGGHVSYGGVSGTFDVTQFHTYTIEWNSSSIKWFVDGAQYVEANILNSINSTEEFHRPFFLILNLAVGGAWPGNPNTTFPKTMQVDYVRVYQQGAPPPPPPPGPTNTPVPNGGGISQTTWYSVINQNSNKCVDDKDGGTANGSIVQQWACFAGSVNQGWLFVDVGGGYYRVMSRKAQSLGWDVSGVSTADSAKVHLWAYGGGNNQQWQAQSLGNGYYRFIARHSGKCLDVPGSSTADGVQLQQYTCNGTAAQSFRLQAQ